MFIIKPRLCKKIAVKFEKNPPKVHKSKAREDITPAANNAQFNSKPRKSNRNTGKQHKRR